jgi:prepilin-type N-terminal cleavage/methylation domain-containing protein
MFQRWLIQRLGARVVRGERGFTMIEVAVAMVIFGALVVGIATTQSSTMNLIRTDRHRSVAANLAAEEMDIVRSTAFTSLAPGRVERSQSVGDVEYTIVRDSEWVLGDATSSACTAPAGAQPKYLSVNVYVSWPVMSGVKPVDSHTLVTPPVGTYDESSGHVGVSVVDRDGMPASNVTVTLSPAPPPPVPASQMTTADGCAFFAFLPAGAYTATVSATGYVNYQGDPAPSQAASVVVGGVSSLGFDYDQAAALEVRIQGKDLGSSAPTDVSLVLANTHFLPSGTKVFPGSGLTRSITGLFPFADGFSVRAGTCADSVAGDPVFVVTPGATTTANIGLPEVRVTVLQDDGTGTGTLVPAEGIAVSATHAFDASCPSGESFALGTTNSEGQVIAALPYGTWTVQSVVGTEVVLSSEAPPADADGTWPYDVMVEL